MTNPLHDALLAPHADSDAPFLALEGGTALTYAAFLDDAGRMAAALSALGLAPGDRVAALVAKSSHALALYAACIRAGLVFLPLNPAYTAAELDHLVSDSAAALLVVDPAREAELAGRHATRLETLGADGGGTLGARAAAMRPAPAVVPRAGDDLAALLYTSGTTGRPKGAMLTHDNLVSNAAALTALWRFGPGDVLLHALPIFHTHGLFVATNVTLMAGGSMILLPRFDPGAVLAALPRATAMMGVPTFYERLLGDPRLDAAAAASIRLFVSGSAPLRPETHRAFEARTGHRILERYGMTETGMIASNPHDGARRPGTVGPPLPGVSVRIRGADGAEAPPGAVGSVEVRGPNVFRGYRGLPGKTAEAMTGDGFFVTGDLGAIDADGYLTIAGRETDLVISGGHNVYPGEVEAVLDAQPGISESAVIGLPDDDLGERVVAVLVPEDGAAPPDLAAIERALAERLARYKRPRRYELAEALPRNAMGKVQKAVLRARLAP